MSEVNSYIGNYIDENGTVHGDVKVFLAPDFDRVTAERDAALGREAALLKEREITNRHIDRMIEHDDELQQRLTAADERAYALEGLLRDVSESVAGRHGTFARIPADWFDRRDDALKPAEDLTNLDARHPTPEDVKGLGPLIGKALGDLLKPAECCTVSAEDRALLDAGDYTPEELFGIGGKPSCPKCAR